MAKDYKVSRERKIGKQVVNKKPLIDHKLRSRIWTGIIIIVLLVFFIINNTKPEPEEGQYPPNYRHTESNSVN
jgi:hypothetical protein